MASFYVPIINNEESLLYKIKIEHQTGVLSNLSICGTNKGQGNIGIDTIIDKLKSFFGDSINSLSIELINVETNDYFSDENISSSTQSICLGLLLAIECEKYQRQLLNNWEEIIVTGDFNKDNSELINIELANKKIKAINKLQNQKNPLFIYVSNQGLEDQYNSNIQLWRFQNGDRIERIIAELFYPILDDNQKVLFDRALAFDKSSEFIRNGSFDEAKKQAIKESWKGFFIYGAGETGKTSFAYHLCSYLVATKIYYAPIWVTIDSWFGLNNLVREKDEKYNGLIHLICRQINPTWTEKDGIDQIRNQLLYKKYILVIDNLELKNSEQLAGILSEMFSAFQLQLSTIITSRFACKDSNLEKKFSIKKLEMGHFSLGQCREIVISNFPQFIDFEIKIQNDFIDHLTQQFSGMPGVIAFISKRLKFEPINDVLCSITKETGSIQEHISLIIKESFSQLPEESKKLLFDLVKRTYENHFISYDNSEIQIFNITEQDCGVKFETLLDDYETRLLRENLSVLLDSNFIYLLDEDIYCMKSLIYKVLILEEIDNFGESNKFISPRIRIETALIYGTDKSSFLSFLSDLRKSDGNFDYLGYLLVTAIKSNCDISLMELLLGEAEKYNETKAHLINGDNYYESVLPVSMSWSNTAEVLFYLLSNGGDPFITDEYGNTILHDIYTEIPDFEAKCDILLKKGLDINQDNYLGESPIFNFCKYGTVEQLAYLVKRNADINFSSNYKNYPINEAVRSCSIDKIRYLISNGASLVQKDMYGYSTIHYSICNYDVFSFLLKNGANIYDETDDEETLLDLIEMGPYIKWNPLACEEEDFCDAGAPFIKVFENELKIHDFLIENDVQRKFSPKKFDYNWFQERLYKYQYLLDLDGIFIRIMKEPLDSLIELFENEEILFIKDNGNKSLLFYAVLNSDISVPLYLLEKGLGVNVVDKNNISLLMWACWKCTDVEIIKILIEKGANTDIIDNEGNTLLHFAALNPCSEIINYIAPIRTDDNKIYNNLGYLPIGYSAANNPNPLVFMTLIPYVTMTELEACYREEDLNLSDGVVLFATNPFCYITMNYYELSIDKRISSQVNNKIIDTTSENCVDIKLKDFMLSAKTENKQKELKDLRLRLSVLNDNPKFAVLWTRQGGNLYQELDDGTSVLDELKKRDDWKYIKKMLLKHKLL